VFEVIAEDLIEGRRVAGVLVGGDLVRRRSGHRDGRAEEGFGGFLIASFAQVDIDQVVVAVDRPVQILPLATHLDVCLVSIPAAAGLAPASLAQSIGEQRRQPGFLVTDRFVAEDDAADQEHLRQIAQAELVT
jgi:hypothetical protein